MQLSRLFSQTKREAPADAEVRSHQLLVRAGFIRQLASGIFTNMPLAKRALRKLENIMREEIDAIGGQEVAMPVIHPADIWKETGRWFQIGSEMGRFRDKAGRDMVLAMTHEEVLADLVRKEIYSYKQLPCLVYHLQTKWRDDPRPRAGLIRVREFTMKDSYSLDVDNDGLDKQYRDHYQAYFNIFNRCGLPSIAVKSDVGMMGGSDAHEFMYVTPIGEDTLIMCDSCGYVENRQIAKFKKPAVEPEELKDMSEVETPGKKTIEELAEFLKLPKSKFAKAIFLVAKIVEDNEEREQLVCAVVRGDMELNETKLSNAVKAKSLRFAHDEEIRAAGAEPGYGSPIGIKNAVVVVDDMIPGSKNLVMGANKVDNHVLDANFKRDYKAAVVTDLTLAGEKLPCINCGHELTSCRGVEIGNIFKLGTRYSDSMGCTFLDKDGKNKPVVMGSYGIGVGRVLACIAEEHNDENGLIWPITVAPYHVHLVNLCKDSEIADKLYKEFMGLGIEVLYDDRKESAGVKFKDADLIGLPLRVVVSDRLLKDNQAELKYRSKKDAEKIPMDEIVQKTIAAKQILEAEIAQSVKEMPYSD